MKGDLVMEENKFEYNTVNNEFTRSENIITEGFGEMNQNYNAPQESNYDIKVDDPVIITAGNMNSEPQYQAGPSANTNNFYYAANNGDSNRAQVYYTESYKKPRQKRNIGFGQLILVSIFSAIFGAGVLFAAIQVIAPVITGQYSSGLAVKSDANMNTSNGKGVDKIVQITSSDSPVTSIAEKVSPSIVGIKVTVASSQDFFFDIGGGGVGEGSGIIISEDGYILTNNHVIENALEANSKRISTGSKIEVILPSQKDKSYIATVVGKDAKSDIAVLKIEAQNLPKAELGDSAALKVGELSVAIGNPGGMDYMGSVTAGVISGLNRTIQSENGTTLNLIQTDAAINPGNSGGALCNSKGQVIGINTIKISATGFEGLGFAIPINHAKKIAQDLIDFKYVKGRPYLGVSIDPRFNKDVAEQYNVPNGLLVSDVTPLSAAYKAGIKGGDIITKFDGVEVKQFSDLENQKNKHKPGDKVEVVVYRDGKTLTLSAALDEDKN